MFVSNIQPNVKFVNSPNIQREKQTNRLFTQTNSVLNFSGGGKLKKAKYAEDALISLTEHLQSGTPISVRDEHWLSPLRKFFGADKIVVNDPNDPSKIVKIDCQLTPEKINSNNGIKSLVDALKTMIAATRYKPKTVKLGDMTYTVHNRQIANLLRENYSEKEFKELCDYLNKHRVFDMSDDTGFGLIIDKERGIAKTCGASENWEMSDRAWVTDIMRVGDIQKKKRPETWVKALNTVAEYYMTQNSNFKNLISNPILYREGNAMQGIPHIFMPKTLEPDKDWFNNKRLESHGLALKELCIGIIDGMAKGKKYGYKSSEDVPQNVIESINNLSKYFKAIDYPSAPSAGNWEEIPLKGGLTSDTEAIRSALNAYKDLLYNPKYDANSEIVKIRNRFADLEPIKESELNELISKGLDRVRKTYLEEAPGIRPHDSSLVFITTSDVKLADNVQDDVKKHVEILESLESNLVRENGIIRYAPFNFILKDGTVGSSPDSYLNLNYFNAVDKNGKLNLDWKKVLDQYASKDCSEPNMFFARAKLSTPKKEAHWFMVSEMSTGYGKQIEKVVKQARKENRTLSSDELKTIENLKKKQTEYLNRALARVSDENPDEINQIKANGLSMPSVTVSEAHQYVTDLDGNAKMLQGTNAPLAWALSSLYKAIKQQAITLKMGL